MAAYKHVLEVKIAQLRSAAENVLDEVAELEAVADQL